MKVVDQCYLCDLCYMTKCPYTPPNEWNVDFPHLMLRAKGIKLKKGDVKTRDKILSATDTVGNLAGIPVVSSIVNASNKNGFARKALKSVLGIHPDAVLPEYLKDCGIDIQSGGKKLATNANNDQVFLMKHDIIFKSGKTTKLIIDTKYKRLDKTSKKCGISQSDMYQMVAYASRYKCPNVILLYPRTADSHEPVNETYELCELDSRIKIATVNLGVDLTNHNNQLKLIDDLNEILQEEV